ncbi:MAG: LysR family substrate-binding domain-containing protein [Cyanobacteria bacterium J06642_11]
MSEYQKQCVDIEFRIHELDRAEQLTALRLGQIDIGFLMPQALPSDIAAKPLIEESLVIALPADHALTTQSRITLVDIAQNPLIMANHQSNILKTHRQYAYLQTQITQTITDSCLLMSLVASGAGLSIIPESIS